MTSERSWDYELTEGNKKIAALALQYVYDGNHNITDMYSQQGQGTGADDWVNYSHFNYVFEQDTVLVDMYAYFWDGGNYAPSYGEGIRFDYSVPVEDIVTWPGGVAYHKVTENRSYTANAGNWEYQLSKYYYSKIGNTDGVRNVKADNGVVVYPLVVTDQINITADGNVSVRLYNLQGALVLKSSEKTVPVGSLASGVYVIDVNGYKTKIVKR